MYAEIQAAISSTRLLADIIKASKELRESGELAAAVSDLNAKLLHVGGVALAGQEKQAALAERIRELEQELVSLKNWDAQAQDYTLQAVGVEKVHFAQVYKPAVQSSKARHWACAKCFQDRKLYILSAHDRFQYKCPNCGTVIEPVEVGGALASIESAYE